jgi:serine/threonine protein kinase/tetratricopeptide (TPR) repeat protein
MNRLGAAPTDFLFGLIALNNDLVAPAVIPAALRAQVLEPSRRLADLLVNQGVLTPAQRDLVSTLSGEYINRHGGDAGQALAALIATPSAGERLDQLGDHEFSVSVTSAGLVGSTVPYDPGQRLKDPESTLPPPANAVAEAKSRIAGYEILELLGTGGMGIVYKARHQRLDRFVALKMIRAGSSARPEDLARFESEAKAVAAIEHSNIVKIFEIGEHDGLPYFSLEFLPGGNLATKIGGQPQPVDQAARIVEVLARAIHVAHQHNVIHRDLKPGNVLLASDGTVKISDFGLVKRLESDSGQTRSGSILGTPSYMAPEQARGENQTVGPAADQYALGAILYELLTGRPPFQGTSVLETLDMVRSREPVPPSQLQPKTPRDLETICLKCLQKEIPRRYPDVLALAEDLRRFRAGETILARPVSDAERLWRWCLRNPRVASLSAAVALLLLVVTAGSAIAAVTVSGQNQALVKAKKLAEEKRAEAVAAAWAANEQNRSAVDSQVELIMLLERKLRFVPAIQDVREQILDKASERLEAAARAMTDLRDVVKWAPEDEEHNWKSLARAHNTRGRLSLSRNQLPDAMAEFRQADEIIARLAAADPADLDMQVNLIRTQRQLGDVSMNRLGDTEEAQRYFRRAIEISRACLAKKPDQYVYKSELANSLGLFAGSELTLGHLEKARELYREESGVRESFSPVEANRLENSRELASHYAQFAELNVRMGDLVEGQRLYDKCASLRQRVAAEQRDSWPAQNDLAVSYNQQGSMRFPQGRDAAAARQFHQKALLVLEKRAKAEPSDLENKHTLAQTLYYEATCALHSGDKPGSAAGFLRCLAICKELATEPKAKIWETDLMLALARCGDHAEAARIAEALVATPPKDERLYVQAACGYALAAGAAGGDASLVQRYKTAALDCLRKAKERGWADVASLEKDTDLEPIRNEHTFQALLREFPRPGEKRP